MSLLEKLCKELGVEVGEEWLGNDGNHYIVEKDDILIKFEDDDIWYSAGAYEYKHISLGLIKPVWKPGELEKYHYPEVAYSTKYGVSIWKDNETDIERVKRGIAFKTKEEAIECANKMLEAIKE